MSKNYIEAKAQYDALQAELKEAGKPLGAYPKGPMGLTPDHIKQSREWQDARRKFDAVFARVRAFNAVFTRTYKKELAAERAIIVAERTKRGLAK